MTALGSKIWSPGDWLFWKGELGRLVTMRKPALSHATMRVYLPLFCLIILIDNQPCWVPALIKPSRVQSQDMEETVCELAQGRKIKDLIALFLQHHLFESSFRLGFWESDMRSPQCPEPVVLSLCGTLTGSLSTIVRNASWGPARTYWVKSRTDLALHSQALTTAPSHWTLPGTSQPTETAGLSFLVSNSVESVCSHWAVLWDSLAHSVNLCSGIHCP